MKRQSTTRKQMTSKLSLLLMVGVMGGLTGCGQGFSSAGSSASGSNSSSSTGGSTDSAADQAFKSLSVDGTVSGGTDSTTQVISIDKTNMQVVVRLPLPLGTLSGATMTPMPINEIPGATIGLEATASGSSALTLRVPLEAYLKGIAFLPAGRLPNGDPLPAIPDGELPSIALQLSKLGGAKVTIYLAPSVIGLYVESPVNPYIGLTLPIRNKAKTRTWGYFSSVPAKGTYKGGFFMSLAMPDDIARIIDDVL